MAGEFWAVIGLLLPVQGAGARRVDDYDLQPLSPLVCARSLAQAFSGRCAP
jgi:hypothetical protein